MNSAIAIQSTVNYKALHTISYIYISYSSYYTLYTIYPILYSITILYNYTLHIVDTICRGISFSLRATAIPCQTWRWPNHKYKTNKSCVCQWSPRSARPKLPPTSSNHYSHLKFVTYVQTPRVKMVITPGRDCGSASWIKIILMTYISYNGSCTMMLRFTPSAVVSNWYDVRNITRTGLTSANNSEINCTCYNQRPLKI